MHPAIKELEQSYRKPAISPVRSGDTVRVHQRIKEGNKERIQVFEGVVIRTHRPNELTACVTVRRIASGVGVEKTFLLHSPNVSKIEILRRAKVRRNFLSYLRERRGKSARLQEVSFDKAAVNASANVKPLAEDPLDQEVTEVTEEAAEQPVAEVSTEEIAKEENKEAAAEEPKNDADAETDEAQLPAEEAQAGVDRASDEDKQ